VSDNILKSFEVKETLNPKVWDDYKSLDNAKLKSDIRKSLLQVAEEFIYFVDVDLEISDIVLMGSLVNFNWSNFSDFDLHVIADFNQFSKEQKDLYEQFFDMKKTLFNIKHNIKILGFEVELYLQDKNSAHFSDGVYSLIDDEFISKPKKITNKINTKLLQDKTKQWMSIIDGAIDNAKDEELHTSIEILKKYYKKLKKYRQCGLEKGGEFSLENLVFKYLRRNGYVGKLLDFRNKIFDKKVSA